MTIWLHVTSSYIWTRPAVGVIRVEQELFAALARQAGQALRYCIFMDGELFEVPASAMQLKPQDPTPAGHAEVRPGHVARGKQLLRLALRAGLLGLATQSPPVARAVDRLRAWRQRLHRRHAARPGRRPRSHRVIRSSRSAMIGRWISTPCSRKSPGNGAPDWSVSAMT